jgi:hypothetical protein
MCTRNPRNSNTPTFLYRASALLAVDRPVIPPDYHMSAEYSELRKLQGVFLRPWKANRTANLEKQLSLHNVYSTIYQSGES